jgi:hypothetical protein
MECSCLLYLASGWYRIFLIYRTKIQIKCAYNDFLLRYVRLFKIIFYYFNKLFVSFCIISDIGWFVGLSSFSAMKGFLALCDVIYECVCYNSMLLRDFELYEMEI